MLVVIVLRGNAQIILIGRQQVIHVHIATVLLLHFWRHLGLTWCGGRLHLGIFVRGARLSLLHRLVALRGGDDALKVVLVRARGLGEGAAEAGAGRGQRELENVVDGVEDEALEPRLENRKGVGALRKDIRLILSLSECAHVHPVSV